MKKISRKRMSLSDEQFHAIMRTLADVRRFAILEQIAATDGLACSALREHDVISPATISHHIKELHESGLVEIERQGRTAHLFLRRSVFAAYLDRLAKLNREK